MRRIRTDWPGIKPPSGLPINPEQPLAKGCVGYWIMPDAGHSIENSAVPGQRGATIVGTITPGQSTPYGLGTLIGANSWYDLGILASLQPPLPLSLFAVFSPSTVSGFNVMIATGNDPGSALYSGATLYAFNGAIRAVFGDNTGNIQLATTSGTMAVGTFYVCSCSIRGASDFSIYLNGVAQAPSYSGTGGAMVNGVKPVKIGAIVSNLGAQGTVVAAGIWNRSLSDSEHKALAFDPFGLFSIPAEPFGYAVPLAGTINAPFLAASESFYSPGFTPSPVPTVAGQTVSVNAG